MKNEELQKTLDARTKEFVDFRRAFNQSIFLNASVEKHVDFQMTRMKSRYESVVESLHQRIAEITTELNNSKREFLFLQLKTDKSCAQRQLEMQVHMLEKALGRSEALSNELIKDKDRVM